MNRKILHLAIPNILSNFSVPLLGMVDTALMGRLDSEIYLGAIALGTILFNFIYWGFGFLRMGTTGLTAQAYGKSDSEESLWVLLRALTVAWSASIFLILFQYPLVELGLWLMKGEEEIKQIAKSYFLIRIYAAPATIGLYAFHGWFLGRQNARIPMFLTITVNLANILFNVWFVLSLGMKADGVALATVIAQYIGLSIAIVIFWKGHSQELHIFSWTKLFDLKALESFFRVNASLFLRTLCLIFVFSFFVSESAAEDSFTLAANQILLQYLHLMAYGVDGFAFAAESLVGRYIGEKSLDKLQQSIKGLLIWGLSLGALFALLYILLGTQLLYVFTDQQQVIDVAREYLNWIYLLPLVGAFAYMWDGIYIGATATRPMLIGMLISTLIFFFPAYYGLEPLWGNHSLWAAMWLFMLSRGIFLAFIARKHIYDPIRARV